MSGAGFAAGLRREHDALWSAVLDHPFVRGIGDGSLDGARFRFYLEQDWVYLVELSRVLALAAARARTPEQMRELAGLLQVTLTEELDGLRRACAQLGVDDERLARVEPSQVTQAYTDALVRVCYEGSIGDIVAALLPCETGYTEIAIRLRDAGRQPEPARYRDWIAIYAGAEMQELAARFVGWCDACAARASADERARFAALYRKSLRYELLFFESAWQRAAWPPVVPR